MWSCARSQQIVHVPFCNRRDSSSSAGIIATPSFRLSPRWLMFAITQSTKRTLISRGFLSWPWLLDPTLRRTKRTLSWKSFIWSANKPLNLTIWYIRHCPAQSWGRASWGWSSRVFSLLTKVTRIWSTWRLSGQSLSRISSRPKWNPWNSKKSWRPEKISSLRH